MNVFVLSTGRCGSYTFAKACAHIKNYTSAHESRTHCLYESRFAYPENHIEIDNRLTWLLGRLEINYGKQAVYVHLKRDPKEVAKSMLKRRGIGIQKAYEMGVMTGEFRKINGEPIDVFMDYCRTVTTNIEFFLKDKESLSFNLENAKEDFPVFWEEIGAQGDYESALAEWDTSHNASPGDTRK